MKKIKLNDNWEFCLINNLAKGDPRKPNYIAKNFINVDIPHDYSITKDFNLKSPAQNEGALLDGGAAIYRKVIEIKKDDKLNYIINFRGILGQSLIYVNNHFVAINKHYYTPIMADISRFLTTGKNVITVFTNNPQPSSRWYSGSGIFRDVYLDIYQKAYSIEEETYLNYAAGKLQIKANIQGEKGDNLQAKFYLYDDDKVIIENDLVIANNEINSELAINNITKWSIDNPKLYQVKLTIFNDEFSEDLNFNYGFREIKITKDGFYLNNENFKLNGVCIHHDNGSLGAADYLVSLKRKLLLFKDMGVNAIRSTHNMASDNLVKLCDEMGFLLFDEAFDTWYMGKRKHDYGRFFEHIPSLNNPEKLSYAELDLAKLIKRDRNHPSVFLYSLGNELDETHHPIDKTYDWAKRLINIVKNLDPNREFTIGQNGYCFINDDEAKKLDKFMALFPICGLNYAIKQYPELLKRQPNWRYFLSESSSAVRSRGVYIDTNNDYSVDVCNEENRNKRKNYYLNDFPTDRVGWGHTALESQLFVLNNKNMFGEFIWTGIDYLGEPTPWLNNYDFPVKSSFFGIIDLAGIPKDDYYFYRSLWNKHEHTLHISGTMNLEAVDEEYLTKYGYQLNKDNLLFHVYSDINKIRVYLNNQFVNEYLKDYKTLDFKFRIPYQNGVLRVDAINDNNEVILSKELKTINKANQIKLILEDLPNKENLYYIKVNLVNNGEIYPYSDNIINIKTSKNAVVLGTDNGNSASLNCLNWQNLKKPKLKLFNGYGVIVIKRIASGVIKIKTTSKGVKYDKIIIMN